MIKTMILTILFTALMLKAQPFAGSGTLGDPYQIGTAAQFDSLRLPAYSGTNGLYFILTADIDLSGYSNWIPIPSMRGQLDGNWHKISNMTITSIVDTTIANYNIGLFASTYLASGTPSGTRNFKHIILYKPRIDIDQQTLVNQVNHYIGFFAGFGSGGISTKNTEGIVVDSGYVKIKLNISNDLYFGGIMGYAYANLLYQCKVMNTTIDTITAVTVPGAGTSTYIGGITAKTGNWNVVQSTWIGDVNRTQGRLNGNQDVFGAIIAYNNNGGNLSSVSGSSSLIPAANVVSNCYVRGRLINVIGSEMLGGIFSRGHSSYSLSYRSAWCYVQSDSVFSPPVSGSDPRIFTGNIMGYADNSTIGFESTFFDVRTDKGLGWAVGVPNGVDTTGMAIITDSLKSQTFLEANGYDFTQVWIIDSAGIKNDGYPYFQWEDDIPVNNINISIPLVGAVVSALDSLVVTWTGSGDYKNVRVNGDTVINNTTTTILIPDTTGIYGIKIEMLSDTTVSDSTYVTVIPSDYLKINYVTVTGMSMVVNVTSSGFDSIRFYVANNPITYTYIDDRNIVPTLLIASYTMSLPIEFVKKDTTYVRVTEDADTNTVPTSVSNLTAMGQPGGQVACWYPQSYDPIEVYGILDVGCGWVSGITTQYTTASAIFKDDTSYTFRSQNSCTAAQSSAGLCTWNQRAFVALDTSSSTYNVIKYVDIPQYNVAESGGGITYDDRFYYIGADSIIYCNDLLNGINDLKIVDIRPYYNPSGTSGTVTHMTNPKLYLFEYNSDIADTLIYNGSFSFLNLPKLNPAKIAIYESSGYQGLWYFNAIQTPNPTTVTADVYKFTGNISILRNYFRGIYPKMKR